MNPRFWLNSGVIIFYALGINACQNKTSNFSQTLAVPSRAPVELALPADSFTACSSLSGLAVPQGSALFVFRNFTRAAWRIQIGSTNFAASGFEPGIACHDTILVVAPGSYTWRAASQEEKFYLPDPEGEIAHHFSIEAGMIYQARVMSLNPATSTLRYVVESEIITQ